MVDLSEALTLPGVPLQEVSIVELLDCLGSSNALVVVHGYMPLWYPVHRDAALYLDGLRQGDQQVPLGHADVFRRLAVIGVVSKQGRSGLWVSQMDPYDNRKLADASPSGGYSVTRQLYGKGQEYNDARITAVESPQSWLRRLVFGAEYKAVPPKVTNECVETLK